MLPGRTDEQSRLAELTAWRQRLVASGVAEGQLPTARDLRRIADTKSPSRAMLKALPFDRRSAVIEWMTEILSRLGEADPAARDSEGSSTLGMVNSNSNTFEQEMHEQRARLSNDPALDQSSSPDSGSQAQRESGSQSSDTSERADMLGPLDVSAFRPWQGPPQNPIATLRVTLEEGGLYVTWPAEATRAPVALYRLVASDEYAPYSPDSGRLVAATRSAWARDAAPMSRAVRHLTVWLNAGADEAAALGSAPVLVGRTTWVSQVVELDLFEDHGRVVGNWTCPPGIARVDIVRVPVAEAQNQGYLPEFLLQCDDDGLQGFVDRSCLAGETYEYRLFSVAVVEGIEIVSPALIRRIHVRMPLLPVRDLVAQERVESGMTVVDLRWTSPPNTVVYIYRTPAAPKAGLEDDLDLVESGLETANLPTSERLRQGSSTELGGRSVMAGVPWPDNLPRVHFTAVSIQDGRARVGNTATLTRTAPVEDVRLLERVEWQLLTFDWPEGAHVVRVHLTATGEEFQEPFERAIAQLDFATYETQGGLRLSGVLPARGCDLHLTPLAHYAGQEVQGAPTRVHYPGLLRLRYRLTGDGGALLGSVLKHLGRLTLEMKSDQQLRQSPPLVLVYHPERLPLDLHDGEALLRVSGPIPQDDWVTFKEVPLERGQKGWLRLFVDWDQPGPRVALLDPPVSSLRR